MLKNKHSRESLFLGVRYVKLIGVSILLPLGLNVLASQDTVGQMLRNLIQIQSGHDGFSPGIFPSYRYHEKVPYCKADENIFFSTVIGIRIKRLQMSLSQENKLLADSLLKSVISATDRFRNKYGRVSYNFWPTRPVRQFPGDPLLSGIGAFHIPDDADDSFLIHYLRGADDSEWTELRKMAYSNAPGVKRRWKSGPRGLMKFQPHGTWLGDKMPPEVDFCVLTNILFVISESGLPFNSQDSASADWLRIAFEKEFVQRKPHRISPQYLNESTCLYHLAFLISSERFTALDNLKPGLVSRINYKFKKPLFENEFKLLRNALAYLGQRSPTPRIRPGYFPLFYANPASVLPNPFNGPLVQTRLPVMGYECPGWDLFLDMEYLLLKSR